MAGITGVHGPGVDGRLIKDATNTATSVLRIDCEGAVETQPFTSQTYEVESVAVALGAQNFPATPPPNRSEHGGGRFTVVLPIGTQTGSLPVKVTMSGTKTTVNSRNNTTVTNPWKDERTTTLVVELDAVAPSLSLASTSPQPAPEASQAFEC